MNKITDVLSTILNEQNILKTTRGKIFGDAIKKRNPVSFFYSGPRKTIKAGKRIKVEVDALGLSKKGNVIIRAYVDAPSTTKTGYRKGHWKTFMVSRMSNIQVHTDEVFNQRNDDQYKAGVNDGSMSVTYIKADWNTTPKVKDKTPAKAPVGQKPEVKPTQKPEPTDTNTLQQPKKTEKPSVLPQTEPQPAQEDDAVLKQVTDKLLQAVKTENNTKTISKQEFDTAVEELSKTTQDAENKLRDFTEKNAISVVDELTPLAEALNRIKTLLYH